MPTKRKPRSRTWRQARITPEALALFIELECLPQDSEAFKEGSRRLARMLGLISEWWTCNHVHDRSRKPCHPVGYIAHTGERPR